MFLIAKPNPSKKVIISSLIVNLVVVVVVVYPLDLWRRASLSVTSIQKRECILTAFGADAADFFLAVMKLVGTIDLLCGKAHDYDVPLK